MHSSLNNFEKSYVPKKKKKMAMTSGYSEFTSYLFDQTKKIYIVTQVVWKVFAKT